MKDVDSVARHYAVDNLSETILSALDQMGKNLEALGPSDLALVDEFHIRGPEATEELARLAGVGPGMDILDVGCGLGGSARYLAFAFDCRVTGLDLTREYCDVANLLSELLNLDGRTTFEHGDAVAMPFGDDAFDLVWIEHVQMNIADKERLYGEIRRVLKPGGRLVFHEIFEGRPERLWLPVPWASEPEHNHLVPPEITWGVLSRLGFRTDLWDDVTDRSLQWFRTTLEVMRLQGPQPLGLHLLMGDDARLKFRNLIRNLEEGRLVVAQGMMTARSEKRRMAGA